MQKPGFHLITALNTLLQHRFHPKSVTNTLAASWPLPSPFLFTFTEKQNSKKLSLILNSDMEEASRSSNREANDPTNVSRNKTEDELTVTGPNISKQTKDAESWKDDQEKDEYYGRYWPLYRMIEKNDWQGVEDFVTNHPDALTAKIVEPGSMTIFHMIVELLIDAESDEAICLLDKLASKVDPETLARQDNHGHTAATLSAAKGNLRALKLLVKYNPDLTNIRHGEGFLPVHDAALYGHKDTFHYLLEVTHGVDIYSGKDGANVLSFLIAANLYDVASDLLKRHPTIGRDSIDSRRIILNTLAQKPYAFASGSRLGRLQRLIYNCSCQLSFANTQTHLYSDLLMKKPSFQ